MVLEAVPLVDEEEDCDGWYGEDEHDEEVAEFGGLFPSESFADGLSCILAAAGAAAASDSCT